MVATVDLTIKEREKQLGNNPKDKIDLKKIAQKCSNVTYNQKRFPAVIMRK